MKKKEVIDFLKPKIIKQRFNLISNSKTKYKFIMILLDFYSFILKVVSFCETEKWCVYLKNQK